MATFYKSDRLAWFSPTIVYNTQSIGNKDISPYDGYVCEMLLYDRVLTQSEREGIELYLMEKWGIAPEEELQGCADALNRLSFDVSNGLGTLLVPGDLDVGSTALEFLGGRPGCGKFLKTSGLLTGPFASVDGAGHPVKYSARAAAFPVGLTVIIR